MRILSKFKIILPAVLAVIMGCSPKQPQPEIVLLIPAAGEPFWPGFAVTEGIAQILRAQNGNSQIILSPENISWIILENNILDRDFIFSLASRDEVRRLIIVHSEGGDENFTDICLLDYKFDADADTLNFRWNHDETAELWKEMIPRLTGKQHAGRLAAWLLKKETVRQTALARIANIRGSYDDAEKISSELLKAYQIPEAYCEWIKAGLEKSIDEKMVDMAIKKQLINKDFERALKEVAVDCELFKSANMIDNKYVCDI